VTLFYLAFPNISYLCQLSFLRYRMFGLMNKDYQ